MATEIIRQGSDMQQPMYTDHEPETLGDVFTEIQNGITTAYGAIRDNGSAFIDNLLHGNVEEAGKMLGPDDENIPQRPRGGGHHATPIEYIDAPYATAYGMNKATAYQEALSNSAHQREMMDLQKAGLNPVLAAMKGGGSATFAANNAGTGGAGGAGGTSAGNETNYEGLKLLVSGIVGVVTRSPKMGASAGAIMDGLAKIGL